MLPRSCWRFGFGVNNVCLDIHQIISTVTIGCSVPLGFSRDILQGRPRRFLGNGHLICRWGSQIFLQYDIGEAVGLNEHQMVYQMFI